MTMSVRTDHALQRVLQAKGISLTFDGVCPVVADFDLSVAPGEIVTVLGPSGVGKSSLLRVLAGLQSASAGEVQVNHESLAAPHPSVALAFQHPGLLPWLTVRQNVAFGLDFQSQPRLSKQERDTRVDNALLEVGLSHASTKYPDQVSGGMAQRTALARCLAREPKVLLLDEPFGALDEITRQSMQALLLAACQKHQIGVVLVTHDIDEALLISDRIALLAGAPAKLARTWQLADHPEPSLTRDLLSPEMVALRVDILKSLRSAIEPVSPKTRMHTSTPTIKSGLTANATAFVPKDAYVH
jgi:NitT/TauT family transport system ATP-binding protein